MLVGVNEGVVDTDVGMPTDEDECVCTQAFEEDLQVGPEEAGVAPLADHVVIWPHLEVACYLGTGISLKEVDPLRAVQFTAKVDQVAPVGLLEEYDRDATLPGL